MPSSRLCANKPERDQPPDNETDDPGRPAPVITRAALALGLCVDGEPREHNRDTERELREANEAYRPGPNVLKLRGRALHQQDEAAEDRDRADHNTHRLGDMLRQICGL